MMSSCCTLLCKGLMAPTWKIHATSWWMVKCIKIHSWLIKRSTLWSSLWFCVDCVDLLLSKDNTFSAAFCRRVPCNGTELKPPITSHLCHLCKQVKQPVLVPNCLVFIVLFKDLCKNWPSKPLKNSAVPLRPVWYTKIEICFSSHSAIDHNVPDRAGA